TTLNGLILRQGPGTPGEIITNFVGNIAMFGIVAKAATLARAAALEGEIIEATATAARITEGGAKAVTLGDKAATFAGRAAKYAAELGKEALMAQVIGYVQVAVASIIDRRVPSAEELQDMFFQQLVGVVGMRFGNFLLETTVDGFQAFAVERLKGEIAW